MRPMSRIQTGYSLQSMKTNMTFWAKLGDIHEKLDGTLLCSLILYLCTQRLEARITGIVQMNVNLKHGINSL